MKPLKLNSYIATASILFSSYMLILVTLIIILHK